MFTSERGFPEALRKHIRAKNVLGKTFSLAIPKTGFSFHIFVCKEYVVTWGSKETSVFVRNTMNACIERVCLSVSSVIETIIYALIEELYENLNELELELDRAEESLAKARETFSVLNVFKKLRRIRKSASTLRMLANRAKVSLNISESVVEETSALIEHLEKLHERLMMLTQFNYVVLSDKTNKVVQKLTVISSIFLPLTLIASIYGMNFRYMPELYHPLGYYTVLLAMTTIAIVQLIYFKKKKWI